MILHLGVVDIPYTATVPQAARRVGVRKGKNAGKPIAFSAAPSGGETTGDVAEILEDRFHVMESFFEMHDQEIADAFANSMGDALGSLLMGAPAGSNSLAAAEADIETMFRNFISNEEMNALGAPGVPTQAAVKGVNHRLAHPYAKGNPQRPSFRDTGLYESSFKAWID